MSASPLFPETYTIDIREDNTIVSKDDRLHEWFGSLVGAVAWLSNLYADERFAFRGHADATWSLTSSLWRHSNATSESDLETAEATIHGEIAEDYWFEREFGFEPTRGFRSLALLQHEGIPTRLLDVTADPLVGLYFAVAGTSVADEHDDKEGALYLFRYPRTTDGSAVPYRILPAPQVSPRVSSQRSLFLQPNSSPSLSGTPAKKRKRGRPPGAAAANVSIDFVTVNCKGASTVTNFGELVERFLNGDRSGRPARIAPNIVRFRIPASSKAVVRGSLRKFGVSAPSLFPGSVGYRRGLLGEKFISRS